jgi:hypothetical protein
MGSSCRSLLCQPFQFLAILVLAIGLSACGSDGSDGKDGKDGAPGEQGPPGENAIDPASVIPITPVLDLSGTVDYSGGTLSVHFTIQDEDGNGIDLTGLGYSYRLLVPAEDPASPNAPGEPGPVWHRMISERDRGDGNGPPGTLTLNNADTGDYTYVADTALPASPNVHRLTVVVYDRSETINGEEVVVSNPVNASYDFLQSNPGTPLASSGADSVTTGACQNCHGVFYLSGGLDGGHQPGHGHYTQYETCVHCHNVDYMGSHTLEADLAFMVHRIHNEGVFGDEGAGGSEYDPVNGGLGEDFSEVTYPQHTYTCATCHDGPDAHLALGTVMTRANCGSCHEDVSFVDPPPAGKTLHEGGALDQDNTCGVCHTKSSPSAGGIALSPAAAHDPDVNTQTPLVDPADVSEFNVTISMTDPPNGLGYYEEGDTPVVTVTLTDSATDTPIDTAFYTNQQGAEGDTTDTNLSEANLYVYGNRSNSVPVLTIGSTTDGGIQQGHNLFLADDTGTANPEIPGAPGDPGVISDAGGFKYQLQAIPADLPAGTYMVRFEGADYGGIASDDYVTSSSAVVNFQVGTADIEHKRSGDACKDCHGETIMHLTGSHAHHAKFDTDHCLACHDLSGNYGDYIGNRVHAVHRASITGDLHSSPPEDPTDPTSNASRDWSEITYPLQPNNCFKCHTDSQTEIPVWRDPNEVACGGCHGTDFDGLPSDYPVDQQDQVFGEITAALHMYTMCGSAAFCFDASSTNPNLDTYMPRACLVCHGDGRIADPVDTHGLGKFAGSEPDVLP